MYLFQSSPASFKPYVCKFTFHYVSISTCIGTVSRFNWCLFTFHYVSISTNISIVQLSQVLHLHSTMYLFQLSYRYRRNNCMSIYIPLCIYLNRYAVDFQPGCYYLHSTMYLFKPVYVWFYYGSDLIYIPLCIYFNGYEELKLYKATYDLHSTMYLFQPDRKHTAHIHGNVFTFHYVSISTFPTYTFEHLFWYLHSTMYLFQQIFSRIWEGTTVIYIPLCIYFNC